MNTVSIRLRPPNCSRSAFLRELLRRAGPLSGSVSYEESIMLLAESARAGKVQAQVALERALREERKPQTDDDWLERLVSGR